MDLATIQSYGTFVSDATTAQPSKDVTNSIIAQWNANQRGTQVFEMYHQGSPPSSTYANFSCSGFGLTVTYLTP